MSNIENTDSYIHTAATPLLLLAVVIDEERRSQSALRESEARFRAVADSAPVLIWMSGTDKLVTFLNKGWLDFTGREEERRFPVGRKGSIATTASTAWKSTRALLVFVVDDGASIQRDQVMEKRHAVLDADLVHAARYAARRSPPVLGPRSDIRGLKRPLPCGTTASRLDLPCSIICVIDDESSVLKAIGRLLASEGLEAETFTQPACFLTYARSHSIGLAVIDVHMPGMTGFEVLAALHAVSPQTRVIIMTAEDDPTHRTTAMSGDAAAFFLKPFDDDAFLQAVRTAIRADE